MTRSLALLVIVCLSAYFWLTRGSGRNSSQTASQQLPAAQVPAGPSGVGTAPGNPPGAPPGTSNGGTKEQDPATTSETKVIKASDPETASRAKSAPLQAEEGRKPVPKQEEKALPAGGSLRAAERGSVSISMTPAGDVTIDGVTRRADAAKPALFELPAGQVTASFRSGAYNAQREQLTVAAGKTASRTFYFERSITIGVRPVYANITVNGEAIGQTDSKVITRGPGRYTFAVTKADYEIDRIELNGKAVPSGEVTVSPGFDDRPSKLIFFLRKKP